MFGLVSNSNSSQAEMFCDRHFQEFLSVSIGLSPWIILIEPCLPDSAFYIDHSDRSFHGFLILYIVYSVSYLGDLYVVCPLAIFYGHYFDSDVNRVRLKCFLSNPGNMVKEVFSAEKASVHLLV